MLLVAFTDFVTDPEARHDLGYKYLDFLAIFLIAPNLTVLVFDITSIVMLNYKKRKILKIHRANLNKAKKDKQTQKSGKKPIVPDNVDQTVFVD